MTRGGEERCSMKSPAAGAVFHASSPRCPSTRGGTANAGAKTSRDVSPATMGSRKETTRIASSANALPHMSDAWASKKAASTEATGCARSQEPKHSFIQRCLSRRIRACVQRRHVRRTVQVQYNRHHLENPALLEERIQVDTMVTAASDRGVWKVTHDKRVLRTTRICC